MIAQLHGSVIVWRMNLLSEFKLDEDIIYLNHAAVAPWPARTVKAITDFAQENLHQGASNYPTWVQVEQQLREKLQRLINAPSVDDIALLKNTSEALSIVAHGLDWQAGDNIVICQQEFPSNRVVWQSLARYGVETRFVDFSTSLDPEHDLIAATDQRTRLLSSSSVQYASGLRMDLARLGEFCQQRKILFCVDAIQSLGALAFDAQAVQADFVMADGHKWMLGPEGVAVFYCRADLRDRLKLNQYGWHMMENPTDYDSLDWQPARSARRFECGSPNMLGIHGLNASLSVILEFGMAAIEAKLLELTQFLMDCIQSNPNLALISNAEPSRLSGITTFRHRQHDTATLFKELSKNKVICAQRGGGIRLSPHFYMDTDRIQKAVELCL